MARTIATIYNQMIQEKETFSNLNNLSPTAEVNPAQSLLTSLTTTSKVAIWRLIFYVVAVAIWIFENQIEQTVVRSKASTLPWWIKTIKSFQYGDTLVWNGDAYVYSTIDSTKQIINQCAIIVVNGTFYIKVATLDATTNLLTPLDNQQISALESYINQVMPAGTDYLIITDVPDKLQLVYTVYVDPTIVYLNVSNTSDVLNGSLLTDSTSFPVQNAINNYIQFLDNNNFNGTLFVSQLTQAILNTNGVSNAIANTVKAKYGILSYQDILATESQSYIANAGYLIIDTTYPLVYPQINYLPK